MSRGSYFVNIPSITGFEEIGKGWLEVLYNDVVVAGVIVEEIAATDDDYTSATAKKQMELVCAGDEVEMDTTAELTIGTSYGVSNAYTVDQSDTTNDVFLCSRVISATRARGFMKAVSNA